MHWGGRGLSLAYWSSDTAGGSWLMARAAAALKYVVHNQHPAEMTTAVPRNPMSRPPPYPRADQWRQVCPVTAHLPVCIHQVLLEGLCEVTHRLPTAAERAARWSKDQHLHTAQYSTAQHSPAEHSPAQEYIVLLAA